MSFLIQIRKLLGLDDVQIDDDFIHEQKLASYDARYQEQEERLNNAKIAVLEGRFVVRYGAAAEHELREQMHSGNVQS